MFSRRDSGAQKEIWIDATVPLKSRALNHSANFHHWSQTTALFWIGVLSSQGGTLYLLNTWLPFGVVPPCCGVITVTVTFFVLPHWRKKTESLFFWPYLLIIFPSAPTWWLRVRGVNSVHFNYDLILWDKGRGLCGGDAGGVGSRHASWYVCVCLQEHMVLDRLWVGGMTWAWPGIGWKPSHPKHKASILIQWELKKICPLPPSPKK